MNGIDISAWQGDENIDLSKVPFDFALSKQLREQAIRTDTLQVTVTKS